MKALRYPDPPEPGAILGPDAHQRYHVITGTDEQGRTLTRPAGFEDLVGLAATERRNAGPRSVAEFLRMTGRR